MNRSTRKALIVTFAAAASTSLAAMTWGSNETQKTATPYMVADLSDKILYVHGTDSVGMYDISRTQMPSGARISFTSRTKSMGLSRS